MQDDDNDRSVASRIARALSAQIVSGALAPGVPVRQDHVAAAFRASHVPVREAFRKLEARGLLVSEPRRGVRVAPLDPASVREVAAMRAALEVLALRQAFPQLGAGDFQAAARALADGEASSEIARWEEANRRFHRAITAPCGMARLMATIDDLHETSARFLFSIWKDLGWRPRSDEEHRAILAALNAGDVETAATGLTRHILDAGTALMLRLEASAR